MRPAMIGNPIRSPAELIATEKPAEKEWKKRWAGRLKIRCFLPAKPRTRTGIMEPCMARSLAGSALRERYRTPPAQIIWREKLQGEAHGPLKIRGPAGSGSLALLGNVFFFGANLDLLVLDVEPEVVVDAHVLIRDPDQREE